MCMFQMGKCRAALIKRFKVSVDYEHIAGQYISWDMSTSTGTKISGSREAGQDTNCQYYQAMCFSVDPYCRGRLGKIPVDQLRHPIVDGRQELYRRTALQVAFPQCSMF